MTNDETQHEVRQALQQAFELVGGPVALARRLEIPTSLPSMWLKRGSVPADYCPGIELETGVRCERLRPKVRWSVLRGMGSAVVAPNGGQ